MVTPRVLAELDEEEEEEEKVRTVLKAANILGFALIWACYS